MATSRQAFAYVVILFFSLTTAIVAEPDMCANRLSNFVAELDPMFEKDQRLTRHSLTPFLELNKKHFPVHNCDVDDMTKILSRFRYFQNSFVGGKARRGFEFSNGHVSVGFSYLEDERRSELHYAIHNNK